MPFTRTCQHALKVLEIERPQAQLLAELADEVADIQRGAQALRQAKWPGTDVGTQSCEQLQRGQP
jgi:hypothetical protein